jgi:predicted secreted acid phosphatase
MRRSAPFRRVSPAVLVAAVAVLFATAGLVVGSNLQLPKFFTPQSENQITNIDVLRGDIKNYYGTPGASTGSGPTAGWTLPLNMDSNYAMEAEKVAADGWAYLAAKAKAPGFADTNPAVVFDVDDTTITTYDYELYSNWDYNPTSNGYFVGVTGGVFTGNVFPAAPGMYNLLWNLHDAGYAIFFITGRGDSQHLVTIANLVDDTTAGFSDLTTTNSAGLSTQVDEVDIGYPMPTAIETGHGAAYNDGNGTFADGLFTKPSVGDYPDYLVNEGFCTGTSSCATIAYKSGTRAYIESQGYDIVASFGDQFSDLLGGYADKTFKMPNPNYYLP